MKNIKKSSEMLKNRTKPTKISQNHEKCRKTGKKPSKMSKNH